MDQKFCLRDFRFLMIGLWVCFCVMCDLSVNLIDIAFFQDRFHSYLDSLTKISPITARGTKRVIRAATRIDMEKQLHYELVNIGKTLSSGDGQEARRAFIEKRDPVFTGKTFTN